MTPAVNSETYPAPTTVPPKGHLVSRGPIVPTQSAIVKACSLIQQEDNKEMCLVIGARPGGCSGLSWEMFFASADDEAIEEDSLICVYSHDSSTLTIVVDPTTASLANGSTLDYSASLTGGGFKITNPNATRTCGCGSSFS